MRKWIKSNTPTHNTQKHNSFLLVKYINNFGWKMEEEKTQPKEITKTLFNWNGDCAVSVNKFIPKVKIIIAIIFFPRMSAVQRRIYVSCRFLWLMTMCARKRDNAHSPFVYEYLYANSLVSVFPFSFSLPLGYVCSYLSFQSSFSMIHLNRTKIMHTFIAVVVIGVHRNDEILSTMKKIWGNPVNSS